MKCRYCGGDVTVKTTATTDNKLAVFVECPKCGKYIDFDKIPVCNQCGSILTKDGICRKCGLKWTANNGLKKTTIKLASEDDVTTKLADLMSSLVKQDKASTIKILKEISKIVPQVYED